MDPIPDQDLMLLYYEELEMRALVRRANWYLLLPDDQMIQPWDAGIEDDRIRMDLLLQRMFRDFFSASDWERSLLVFRSINEAVMEGIRQEPGRREPIQIELGHLSVNNNIVQHLLFFEYAAEQLQLDAVKLQVWTDIGGSVSGQQRPYMPFRDAVAAAAATQPGTGLDQCILEVQAYSERCFFHHTRIPLSIVNETDMDRAYISQLHGFFDPWQLVVQQRFTELYDRLLRELNWLNDADRRWSTAEAQQANMQAIIMIRSLIDILFISANQHWDGHSRYTVVCVPPMWTGFPGPWLFWDENTFG